MTNPRDHTIAKRVRAEPTKEMTHKLCGDLWRQSSIQLPWSECGAVIAAYRALLLADEPPLTDEQISDRSVDRSADALSAVHGILTGPAYPSPPNVIQDHTAEKRLREAVNDWHDVPPEYESEPVLFHKGWETAIRRVQALLPPIDAQIKP